MRWPVRRRFLPHVSVVAIALAVLHLSAAPAAAATAISGFSPTHGRPGDPVAIHGSGFLDTGAVAFGGVHAAFTVEADDRIAATVPAGARTGSISVTTPDGTARSSDPFTVDPPPEPPSITSFSPVRGPEGASVTITGSGLSGVTEVRFAGTAATFTVDSDTSVTATVPVGATTGRISVEAPPDSATSAEAFVVQPNIVMILTDDQRWDTLWAMPTVGSELVAKGIRFDDAFVVNPLCCPSRVSFLTGQYSHTSGVYSNRPPYGGFESFQRDDATLATWLRGGGYHTGLVGKYLNQYGLHDPTYIPPGWDRWVAFTNGGPGYLDYNLNVDGEVEPYGTDDADYSTDVLAGYADAFIRSSPADRPLFLWMAPFAPHGGALPAARHAGAFADMEAARPRSFDEADVSDKPAYIRTRPRMSAGAEADVDTFRRRQYQTLLAVDEAVDRVIDALADTGRLANTLIVFGSDNGFSWGEHRWRYKVAPYEEDIRVPLVVRWDPYTAVPRTEQRLALNIDIAPTLAGAAGVQAVGADGRSLLPIVDGTAGTWRARFLVESYEYKRDGILIPSYCAVRTEDRKFVHYATGEEEFYTLKTDPFELKNKISLPAFRTSIGKLRARARALCDPLPPGMSGF